jgi:hypothetical protein
MLKNFRMQKMLIPTTKTMSDIAINVEEVPMVKQHVVRNLQARANAVGRPAARK